MPGSRPRFQVASRSAGKSACAMAAYRAAEKIEDLTYGKAHDYSPKTGVLHTEIMAPEYAPSWVHDRAALWNAVEQSELKKDGSLKVRAQLVREVVVPLPHELSLEQNRDMLREWIDEQFVSRGMIADFSIHAPDRKGDQRNFHAHVMLTMREITPEGFNAEKKNSIARDWNKPDLLDRSIDRWESIQNRELELAGIEARADFSSFKDRGLEQEPQQHEGPAVTQMRRKGEKNRVAEENDQKKQRNKDRASRHFKALHEIVRVEEERRKFADWQAIKTAELDTMQRVSLIELERLQQTAELIKEGELQAYYEPQLSPVIEEAQRFRQITEGAGILRGLRRLIRGQKDLEKLEALRRTIADTMAKMEAERRKLSIMHEKQKRQLIELQLERKREQEEGFGRKAAEKEAEFSERSLRAQFEAETTAKPHVDIAAQLERVRQMREKIAADKERELLGIDTPEKGKDRGGFEYEP